MRFLLILTGLSLSVVAQPIPGDIIIGSSIGLYHVAPPVGATTCQPTLLSSGNFKEVEIGLDNRSVIALTGSAPAILRWDPAGSVRTLGMLPSGLRGIDLEVDQDGAILIVASSGLLSFSLLRFDPSTSQFSTIVSLTNGSARRVVLDDDTGDYLVGYGVLFPNQDYILSVDRRTYAVTTVCQSQDAAPLDHDQRTGNFVVKGIQNPVFVMDRSCNRLTSAVHVVEDLKVMDEQNVIHAVAATGPVYTFDRQLNVVAFCRFSSFLVAERMDVWGRRKLVGGYDALARRYDVRGQFIHPGSAGSAYCLALSFGLRPGLSLGSTSCGLLNLNVSHPAFFLSACGGLDGTITTGFAGTTDGTGGVPRVHSPAGRTSVRPYVARCSVGSECRAMWWNRPLCSA